MPMKWKKFYFTSDLITKCCAIESDWDDITSQFASKNIILNLSEIREIPGMITDTNIPFFGMHPINTKSLKEYLSEDTSI